jgi:hypothetical protein
MQFKHPQKKVSAAKTGLSLIRGHRFTGDSAPEHDGTKPASF